MDDRARHDQFLKSVFQYPDKARAYFEERLPTALVKVCDWDTLERQGESYINQDLQNTFSDVVYKVQLKREDQSLYLSILLEHKSYPDPWVTIQIGSYIFNALRLQVSSGQPPAPVIPVLFYHGKEVWPYHTHRSLYEKYDSYIQELIPDFEYIYHDLQQTSDDELAGVKAELWRSILMLMKYARQEEMLLQRAGVIFDVGKDSLGNFLRPMLIY